MAPASRPLEPENARASKKLARGAQHAFLPDRLLRCHLHEPLPSCQTKKRRLKPEE
ncbi:hypothetical protein V5799_030378, partial [Amblyomma americanum]